MRDLVKATLEEHRQVVAKMAALEGEIASAGELCADALALGRRIYLCGNGGCLLYTSPSPRDLSTSRMPSSA